MSKRDWSDWVDYNQDTLSKTPETSGVYMMHENMKILFIGGSKNIKKSIEETTSEKCISSTSRFRYKKEENYEKISKELISDFKKRHEGKYPVCMN